MKFKEGYEAVHMVDNYTVFIVPEYDRVVVKGFDGADQVTNYCVVHNVHKTVEYQGADLPTVLSVCEQLNNHMKNKSYLTDGAGSMISRDMDLEEFMEAVNSLSDEDDGGMLN